MEDYAKGIITNISREQPPLVSSVFATPVPSILPAAAAAIAKRQRNSSLSYSLTHSHVGKDSCAFLTPFGHASLQGLGGSI